MFIKRPRATPRPVKGLGILDTHRSIMDANSRNKATSILIVDNSTIFCQTSAFYNMYIKVLSLLSRKKCVSDTICTYCDKKVVKILIDPTTFE